MKVQKITSGALITMGALCLVAIGGWVANIVKFIDMDFGTITGMLIVRFAGIFVPPLGAILGFF